MTYSFTAFGHPNITGTHKTTLEFTKDKELSKEGSCIIGVNSDFRLDSLKKLINTKKTIKIIIKINKSEETVNASVNPLFDDNNEIVVRKSDFISKRTFGIKADKAAIDLSREFVENIKDRNSRITVIIQ